MRRLRRWIRQNPEIVVPLLAALIVLGAMSVPFLVAAVFTSD